MEGNNKEEVLEEKKQNSIQKNLNKLRAIMENMLNLAQQQQYY